MIFEDYYKQQNVYIFLKIYLIRFLLIVLDLIDIWLKLIKNYRKYQKEKLDSIISKYNLDRPNEFKINKLGEDINYKKNDKLDKELVDNIFLLSVI